MGWISVDNRSSMKSKLDLLKQYIDKQAEDFGLWFEPKYVTECYLQRELRRVAWLIEDANVDEIKSEIEKYKERL